MKDIVKILQQHLKYLSGLLDWNSQWDCSASLQQGNGFKVRALGFRLDKEKLIQVQIVKELNFVAFVFTV